MDDRTTVQDLINQLQQIEDKTQPIVFQYYLAEDFNVDIDSFAQASAYDYHWDGLWSEAYASLKEFLGGSQIGYY